MVCQEDFADGEEVAALPCRHSFHAPCIAQWLAAQKVHVLTCTHPCHNPLSPTCTCVCVLVTFSGDTDKRNSATTTFFSGGFANGLILAYQLVS